jgi:HAD superfamily hydrolase (TIGR01509 family)
MTVVFDLGKVLLDFDYRFAADQIARHSRASTEDLIRLLFDTPLLHRYESGQIDTPVFFEEFRVAAGFKAGFDLFARHFTGIFRPIPAMIRLHNQLRAAGVPTALLSNTNELQFQHIRQQHPFLAGFDPIVLSYEHGAMKPDPALYRVVESRTGHTGPNLVFLDDRPENVQAALSLGWRAFVHETPDRSRRRFIKLGLLHAI